MVGPSSSHTAGALRCAQVAASLLEGASPRSPLACGTPSPTPTAATAPIVRSSRASWASTPMTRTSSRPSTSRASRASNITLTSKATTLHPPQHRRHRNGRRHGRHRPGSRRELGGGKMRISRINGVGVDISGMYSTLFVAHKDVPGVLAALTNLLAYAHVNIAFCRTYRTEVGGQAYSVFETDARPTTPSSPCCASSTMSITRPLSSSPVLPRRSPPASRQRRSSTTASSCSMRARNWDSASVPSWPFARHV